MLLWLVTFINFVVLGYLFKNLDKLEKQMSVNKDELSRYRNEFNEAIDAVVKVIEDLKAGADVITVADIKAALDEPLERLKAVGKPPVEPVEPVEEDE
jgi:hypothetical protein